MTNKDYYFLSKLAKAEKTIKQATVTTCTHKALTPTEPVAPTLGAADKIMYGQGSVAKTAAGIDPKMTAKEWAWQMSDRMRIPGMPMKTPEMRFHEYAYSIPEKTVPSYSYLGRKPSKEELWEAYPYDIAKAYAKADSLRNFRSSDELRQEMYVNDQRRLMSGRKPLGRPLQTDIPSGKFTLKRNAVYNDLLRQYRGQPKVGPYR